MSVGVGKPGLEIETLHIKNTSWDFWTMISPLQGKNRIVNKTKSPRKQKLFDCDPGERNEAGSYWKNEFEYRERLILPDFFLEYSDYQDSDSRRKINDFSLEYSSTNEVFD